MTPRRWVTWAKTRLPTSRALITTTRDSTLLRSRRKRWSRRVWKSWLSSALRSSLPILRIIIWASSSQARGLTSSCKRARASGTGLRTITISRQGMISNHRISMWVTSTLKILPTPRTTLIPSQIALLSKTQVIPSKIFTRHTISIPVLATSSPIQPRRWVLRFRIFMIWLSPITSWTRTIRVSIQINWRPLY